MGSNMIQGGMRPTVLATSGGCHTGHLGHGCDRRQKPNERSQVHLDSTSSSSVPDDKLGCAELGFPRCHQNHRETEYGQEAKVALHPVSRAW